MNTLKENIAVRILRKKFSRVLALLAAAFLLCACQTTKIEPIAGDRIGIVLMHGKGGTQKYIRSLASSLEAAGVLVEAPLMPWSKNRIYDKGYEESMDEIDTYVANLKAAGARRIIVAGHSLGANAALGYAARREGLSGVILLAYGHVPGMRGFARKLASSVQKADEMIAAGRGEDSASFKDANQGGSSYVRGTANDILSWFDPIGPATINNNAPDVNPDMPILCVYATAEKHPRCSKIERWLNFRSQFKSVEVSASHVETPAASITEVGIWLSEL